MPKSALLALAGLAVLFSAACEAPADDPTPVQGAESAKPGGSSAPKKAVPIKLVAKKAKAVPVDGLSDGPVSCAKVTVTNQTKKQLDINPLYFSLTDTTGEKHDTSDALASYEDQIATTELAPGEKVTGMVCGKGKWTPKQVAMTNPLFSEAARAEVS